MDDAMRRPRRKQRNDQQQRPSLCEKKENEKKDAAENSYRNSFIRPSLAAKNGIVVGGLKEALTTGGPSCLERHLVWWWWLLVFWVGSHCCSRQSVAPATQLPKCNTPGFSRNPLSQVTSPPEILGQWTVDRRQSSAVCPTTLNLKHVNPAFGNIGSHLVFPFPLPCHLLKISGALVLLDLFLLTRFHGERVDKTKNAGLQVRKDGLTLHEPQLP